MVCKSKQIVVFVFCALFLLMFVSCSNEDVNDNDNAGVRDVYVYSSETIDIYDDDLALQVYNVIPYNQCYYAIVQGFSLDLSSTKNYLYCIDCDGIVSSKTEIDADANVYVSSDIINDELLYVTYSGKIEKMNIHTGEKVYSYQTSMDLCGISSCDDGYVVLSVGLVEKYDNNNKLLAAIENEQWIMFNGYRTFYQTEEKYYLLSYAGFRWAYYELNFDNHSSSLVFDPSESGKYLYECSGDYIFNEEGEYFLDIENSCMYPLAIWNETDLRPPQYTFSDPNYIGVNDVSFLQIYNYQGGFSQIVIYSYEETEKDNDRVYLTVGGFNCRDDLSLNWAIYKYNTSQDEYRVVIEDYSIDFGWETMDEAVVKRAELIKYFNEGNTPDLYYGDSFDYEYFASNGATLDISQYMTEDFKKNFDNITPNIKNLMLNDKGECYSIFSAYQINGYLSSFDVNSNMSISDVIQTSNELGVTLICNEKSISLSCNALLYGIANGEIDSVEEIQQILEYSYEYGISNTTQFSSDGMNRLNVNDYLLWPQFIPNTLRLEEIMNECNTSFVFVGYPSIDESKHVITPLGQVAISSTTAYPEECSQFISFLLDEEVQDLSNLSWFTPVSDSCMKKMIEYSMDHSVISEEEFAYKKYLGMFNEVDSTVAEKFCECIYTVDTVRYCDGAVMSIIIQETESHYIQDKPADIIAEALFSRLNVYFSER